jgi:hypothetical protein
MLILNCLCQPLIKNRCVDILPATYVTKEVIANFPTIEMQNQTWCVDIICLEIVSMGKNAGSWLQTKITEHELLHQIL